jgi:antitoxin FitA
MHAVKNIQIRNVPEKTHAVLRRRANAAGMSLQEYLLSLVNDAASKPTVEEVLRRAARRDGGRFRMRDAVADLRSDRDSH